MNVIKINRKVFDSITSNEDWDVNIKYFPFDEFIIAFPYIFFQTEEEMIEDMMSDIKQQANTEGLTVDKAFEGRERELEKQKKKVRQYARSDLNIIVKKAKTNSSIVNDATIIDYKIKHTQPLDDDDENLFIGSTIDGLPLEILEDKMSNDSFTFLSIITRLTVGVIDYLNQPLSYQKTEEIYKKTKKKNNKKSKKMKKNIRYIKKTVYNINNIMGSSAKEYERHTDSWQVRGHWMHYKNGKKVWRKAYTKGDKEKIEDATYKITDLNK